MGRWFRIAAAAALIHIAAAAMQIMCGSAFAQTNFPSKSVHILVPYPAGGGVDVLTRTLGDVLDELVAVARTGVEQQQHRSPDVSATSAAAPTAAPTETGEFGAEAGAEFLAAARGPGPWAPRMVVEVSHERTLSYRYIGDYRR